jgi:hypothetical protein
MLTFICGWRSPDRDSAIVKQRTTARNAIFIVDNQSTVPDLLPNATVIDLWRNGRLDFDPTNERDTLIRVNYDTDNVLLQRALTRILLNETDAQIIVTFDAGQSLSRLFPALRDVDALLTANERFDAPVGDHIVFTRGGSFRWSDRLLEAKTVLLHDSEVLDGGIVPDTVPDIYNNPAWG